MAIWFRTSDYTKTLPPKGTQDQFLTDYLPYSTSQRPMLAPMLPLISALLCGFLIYTLPYMAHWLERSSVLEPFSSSLKATLGLKKSQLVDHGIVLQLLTLLTVLISTVVASRLYRQSVLSTPKSDVAPQVIYKVMLLLTTAAALLAVSIVNFSLAFFLALTLAPVSLMIAGQQPWLKRMVLLLMIMMASPLAYSVYYTAWSFCEKSDVCDKTFQETIRQWKPHTWARDVVLKDGDYLVYSQAFATSVALELYQWLNSALALWSQLFSSISFRHALTQPLTLALRSHLLLGGWLYPFVCMVWWPLTIAQLVLVLN
jgi:hypothetical protein